MYLQSQNIFYKPLSKIIIYIIIYISNHYVKFLIVRFYFFHNMFLIYDHAYLMNVYGNNLFFYIKMLVIDM